ncbi:exonuclease [Vibrio phage K436]
MDLNAITSVLSHQADGDVLPEHPYRRLNLDADGVVYQVCHPDKSLESNLKELYRYIENLRVICGAQWVINHTTLALKGGREQMAYYKAYQKGRNKQMTEAMRNRVNELRAALVTYQTDRVFPCPQFYQEADDSLTTAHLDYCNQMGDGTASVIGTGDKDLNMTYGIIINLKTKKFTMHGDYVYNDELKEGHWYNTYGNVAYENKKLVGRGHAFFWGQMLAGDTVDNIAGLPELNGHLVDRYKPLKRKTRAPRPNSSCGASTAVMVLSHCGSDRAAYRCVAEAYRGFFGNDWKFFFFEMAFLLWMRRTHHVLDVMTFLAEVGFEYELHPHQQAALVKYGQACQELTWNSTSK